MVGAAVRKPRVPNVPRLHGKCSCQTLYCLRRRSQKVYLRNWSVCPPFMQLFIELSYCIYWLLFLDKLVKYFILFVWLTFVLPLLVK